MNKKVVLARRSLCYQRVNGALWMIICPECGRKLASASEYEFLPIYSICACQMLKELEENGISIEEAMGGYFYFMKEGKVWLMDSACEDMYDWHSAVQIAWDKLKE